MTSFPADVIEEFSEKRTRGTRKKPRREVGKVDDNFELKLISPKTDNQKLVFDHFDRYYNLLLHGSAGTGKTFISLYLALRSVIEKRKHKRIAIVRSAVPTRDIGFLPGTTKEKLAVYEAPYQAIFTELFGRADAYSIMKLKKIVEFVPTSFVRGVTMDDTIIVVDEVQNLTSHECDSIITRMGENTRIIFSGDYHQSDFTRDSDRRGLGEFTRVLDQMKSFRHVEFTEDDIVRSATVKDYIVNKNKLGLTF